MDGVFLLNKPLGISSNRALQIAKRKLKVKKAGHTGTLDVEASGMLPLVLGEACKFSQFLLDADKCYHVVGELGVKTDTADATGEVIESRDTSHLSEEQVSEVILSFLGESKQVPSMYSALKHQGVPLYQLAREGKTVERKSRTIQISRIDILAIDLPLIELRVICSKGTYIRNLIEDMGEKLHVGAHVKTLHRDYVAPFDEQAMTELDSIDEQGSHPTILPVDSMFPHLPKLSLNEDQVKALYFGQGASLPAQAAGLYALYDPSERFIGMGDLDGSGALKVKRLLSQ